MGKRTHGPQLLHAIEANDHAKVHELLAVQVKNKTKIHEILLAEIRRLPQDTVDIPLLLAGSIPDPSILKYFITKHGIDVNYVYKYGYHGKQSKSSTLLINAIRRGLYATVEVLLALNADPAITDHKGRTALHHAVRRANYRMAKLIVARGGNPNAAEKGQNSPLHVATKLGHVELVRLLLKYGGDLYKRGMYGALPIHIAAKEGHVALVQLFAQHEVNVNTKVPCFGDEREKTPLHVAAEEGHKEMVLVLIEHFGADVNMPDSEGETALHCTVIREYDQYGMKSKDDYADTAKVIIRCGGDVNMRNGRGETPLHLSARNEFHKIIDLLIIAGADPFIGDNDGNKAIDLVAEEDTVSKQTLKRAMEDREKFVKNLMEMRGLSASLTSVPGRGMSLNNLPGVMSNLGGRAMSASGLSYSDLDGRQALYAEDGYLLPNNMGSVAGSTTGSVTSIPGLLGPSIPVLNMPLRSRQNSISSLSSFHSMASHQINPYGYVDQFDHRDSDSKDSIVSESALGRRRKKSTDTFLNRQAKFDYSSDSSQYEENEKQQRRRSNSLSNVPAYLQMNGGIPDQMTLMLQQQHQQQQQQAILLKQRLERQNSGGGFAASPLRSSNRSLQAFPRENEHLIRNQARSSLRHDSRSSSQRSSASSIKRSPSTNSDVSSVKEMKVTAQVLSTFRNDDHHGTPSPRSSTSSGPTNDVTMTSNIEDEDVYENVPDDDVATDIDVVYRNVEETKPPPPAPRKRVFPAQLQLPQSPQNKAIAVSPPLPPTHSPPIIATTTQKTAPRLIPLRTTSQGPGTQPIAPRTMPPTNTQPVYPPKPQPILQSTYAVSPSPVKIQQMPTVVTVPIITPKAPEDIKPELREIAEKLAQKMTPKPIQRSMARENSQDTLVNGHHEGISDSDDTFFDDDSFDTVSDYGEEDRRTKPAIAPKPAARKTRPKQPPPAPPPTKSPEKPQDPKVQQWLENQADYNRQRQEEVKKASPEKTKSPTYETSSPASTTTGDSPSRVVESQLAVAENTNGPVGHSSPSTAEKVNHTDFDGLSDISSVSTKKKTKKKTTKKKKEKSEKKKKEKTGKQEAEVAANNAINVGSPKLPNKPAPPPKPAGIASPAVVKKFFNKTNGTKSNRENVPAHIALEESFDISMDESMTWDDDTGIVKHNNNNLPVKSKLECEYVDMNNPDDGSSKGSSPVPGIGVVPNSGHHMATVFDSNTDTVIRRAKGKGADTSSSEEMLAENRRHSSTKDRYVEQPGFSEVPARFLEAKNTPGAGTVEVRVKRSMSESQVIDAPLTTFSSEPAVNTEGTYEELPAPVKRRVKIGGEQSVDPSTLRPPPNHDLRRVIYNSGGKPRVSIVGGNSDGIYVHRIDPGSDAEIKGLLEGDQIVKINGRSLKGMTREEVTLFLMSLFDTVDMVVRYKKDRYMHILKNGGMGDSFFVRAWFNYKPLQSGEVRISKGDIFSVRDTLPDGRMGSWRVLKVNAKTNEPQNGFVPNEARAEQVALASLRKEEAHLYKEQRGGFLRRSIRRAKSADRLGRETEAIHKSHNLQDVRTYERVEQRPPSFIRPVVLLGLFCDVALDRLVENSPGIFQKAPADLESVAREPTADKPPINITAVQEIMETRKHCLMIVSPKSIEYLQQASLYPIVVYLSPGSKMVVKTLRNKLAPNFEKKTSFMYDEAINFEKQYSQLFTATVTYTTDDTWFTLLLDTVQRIQNQHIWQPVVFEVSEDSSSMSSENSQGKHVVKPFSKVEDVQPYGIPDPIKSALKRHASEDPLKPPSQTSLTYNGFFMEEGESSPGSGRPPVGNFTRVGSTRPPQRGKPNFRPNHSADELTLDPLVPTVPRSILKKRSQSDASVTEPAFLLGQSGSSPNLVSPPTPTETSYRRKGSLPSPRSPSPSGSIRSTHSATSPPSPAAPPEDVFMQQVMSHHSGLGNQPPTHTASLGRQRGRSATRQLPQPTSRSVNASPIRPTPQVSQTKKDEQWKVVVGNMLNNLVGPDQANSTIEELDMKSPQERLQCIQEIIALWNKSRINPNTVESEI